MDILKIMVFVWLGWNLFVIIEVVVMNFWLKNMGYNVVE